MYSLRVIQRCPWPLSIAYHFLRNDFCEFINLHIYIYTYGSWEHCGTNGNIVTQLSHFTRETSSGLPSQPYQLIMLLPRSQGSYSCIYSQVQCHCVTMLPHVYMIEISSDWPTNKHNTQVQSHCVTM